WTVLKLLEWTAGYFREQGIESGRLDAELLLAQTLGLDRVGLYLHYDRPLNSEELAAYRGLVKRRAAREP
ncbi:MAG: protein-(glutamine-N5) methyltransferase, release factor-specific, partial [Desulfuromonadales bacterium]|nr:protein-(glutamine-N5) methyltransferase, release factor-specific [Desulfuromonadales bacterium]NIS40312.1 protein-(glutamine-N5) methyltransferase, release factor-specific [Desulfuromonadales bacterium]